MRVRKGSVYRFEPGTVDLCFPQHYSAVAGQLVRVVQLPGAPSPNVMNMAHVDDATSGVFLGFVSTHSLFPRHSKGSIR